MIGEREDFSNMTEYGTLNMRSYDIDGNEINAFYDSSDDLVFVMDNTINQTKPNILLVINPQGDKKWDEILSGEYDVDLETIRPKQDNKYQKLDIEYSGLSVYENLINAYVAGDDLTEYLVQLDILRDSAARHSAMMRLNVANDIIAKTNVTIVKTKETIVRLQERIKTLRSKLSDQKKEIGKVPTKQSAAKILKIESMIEATNEKLKRAKKRLDSAQKRLETATVDAELASDVLNQPALEIKQDVTKDKSKSVIVAPRYEVQTMDDEDNEEDDEDYENDVDTDNQDDLNEEEVKPLFDENPNILDEDIAFKPISFDAPVFNTLNNLEAKEPEFNSDDISDMHIDTEKTEHLIAMPDITEPKPVLESMTPVEDNYIDEQPEQKPVFETFTPVEPIVPEQKEPVIDSSPVEQSRPEYKQPLDTQNTIVPPVLPNTPAPVAIAVNENNNRSKPSVIYYLLLFILICLSVLTLWLYQRTIDNGEPLLTANVPEQVADKISKNVTLKPKLKKSDAVKSVAKVAPVTVNQVETVKQTESVVKPEVEEEFVYEEELDEESGKDDVITPDNNDESETAGESDTDTSNTQTDDIDSSENVEDVAVGDVPPVVLDAVPEKVMTSGVDDDSKTDNDVVDESNVDKPAYETGSKHDDMFIAEQDYDEPDELVETQEVVDSEIEE